MDIRFPTPDEVRPLRPAEAQLLAEKKLLANTARDARKARRAIEIAMAKIATARTGKEDGANG